MFKCNDLCEEAPDKVPTRMAARAEVSALVRDAVAAAISSLRRRTYNGPTDEEMCAEARWRAEYAAYQATLCAKLKGECRGDGKRLRAGSSRRCAVH